MRSSVRRPSGAAHGSGQPRVRARRWRARGRTGPRLRARSMRALSESRARCEPTLGAPRSSRPPDCRYQEAAAPHVRDRPRWLRRRLACSRHGAGSRASRGRAGGAGVAAAVVAPSALSLITTGFAEGRERTRALGPYRATASVGAAIGLTALGVAGFVTVERHHRHPPVRTHRDPKAPRAYWGGDHDRLPPGGPSSSIWVVKSRARRCHAHRRRGGRRGDVRRLARRPDL